MEEFEVSWFHGRLEVSVVVDLCVGNNDNEIEVERGELKLNGEKFGCKELKLNGGQIG